MSPRVKPTILINGARAACAAFQILVYDTIPPNEDLPVTRNPDFLAADHFAERAASYAEWVVHRHHRARFGETVALDHEQADPGPKGFCLRVQHGATDNKGPEFQSEGLMDIPVTPPPAERPARFRRNGFGSNIVPLDISPQAFENAGHADKDRNPLLPNRLADHTGVQPCHERRRAFEEEWDEDAHGLPEHMAERQQVKDSDRLEGLGPFLVPVDFLSNRVKVGTDVAMKMDHSLGLGSGSRGVNDLDHIVAAYRSRAEAGSNW